MKFPLWRSSALTLVFTLLTTATTVAGEAAAEGSNWPNWRGPDGNGVSPAKNVPLKWSADDNVAWRVALPGQSGATPCVWGERIFLTSVDGDDLVLLCFDTSGKQQWRQVVGSGDKKVRGDEGNMASPSPTTDGKHVWAMMGQGSIACYTVAGKPVWDFNLQERFGKFKIAFGMSSSPVLHDGKLFLQLIHGEGKAATQEAIVVSLDATTGKTLWKIDRVTAASNENEHSYASPMIFDHGDTQYLITHGADYAIAHSLKDGSEIWRLEGLNPQKDPSRRYHPTLRFVASPVANEGIVVVPTAKNGPVVVLDGTIAKGKIDQSSDAHLWTRPQNTPDVPSPLVKDGLCYLCRENGNLMVLDARTGKEHYEERTNRTRHRASPVWADGRIYLTGRDGKVTVVQDGPQFKVLAENETGQEMAASPVIINGRIYLRTFEELWAIDAE